KAQNTYTFFQLRNDISYLISKSLKEFQKELPNYSFCRINRSYLINMNYAIKLCKNGHTTIELAENSVFRISKNRLKQLEESFLRQKEVHLPIEKCHSHTEKGMFTM
ncbi:MAG: LytTR family transcriptional regulator, partial [Bacteroidales bacterium]|nr:LytTR family transcriptional regulator [Bacteroidales bacterium]